MKAPELIFKFQVGHHRVTFTVPPVRPGQGNLPGNVPYEILHQKV